VSAYRLPLILLLSAAGLGLSIQERLTSPAPKMVRANSFQPESVGTLPPEAAEPSVSPAPLQSFSEIVARPLFTPTRRPPVPRKIPTPEPAPPAPEPAAPPPQTGQFTLVGTIIGEDVKTAVLRSRNGDQLLRVGERESIAGWHVESIEWNRVVIRQAQVSEALRLHDSGREANTDSRFTKPRRLPGSVSSEALVSEHAVPALEDQGGEVELIRYKPAAGNR